jgi:hypothetical protein
MESTMPHAEMVLVIPVLAFTFLVMGWIVSQFRGYLKQREAIMASWEQWPDKREDHGRREAA